MQLVSRALVTHTVHYVVEVPSAFKWFFFLSTWCELLDSTLSFSVHWLANLNVELYYVHMCAGPFWMLADLLDLWPVVGVICFDGWSTFIVASLRVLSVCVTRPKLSPSFLVSRLLDCIVLRLTNYIFDFNSSLGCGVVFGRACD